MSRVFEREAPPACASPPERSGVEAELGALCQSCGLCCDGSLFGRVPLGPDEAPPARKSRLRVLSSGNAFEQPCSAMSTRDGQCACAIYAERPRACQAFTCRLYDRQRRDGGPLEARLESVRRVRALLALLEATPEEDARRGAVAELTRRIDEDFARAGAPSPGPSPRTPVPWLKEEGQAARTGGPPT